MLQDFDVLIHSVSDVRKQLLLIVAGLHGGLRTMLDVPLSFWFLVE